MFEVSSVKNVIIKHTHKTTAHKGNEDSPSVKAAGEFLGLQDQMIDNLQLQSTTTLGDIDANSLNIINANRNKALKSLQSQNLHYL